MGFYKNLAIDAMDAGILDNALCFDLDEYDDFRYERLRFYGGYPEFLYDNLNIVKGKTTEEEEGYLEQLLEWVFEYAHDGYLDYLGCDMKARSEG